MKARCIALKECTVTTCTLFNSVKITLTTKLASPKAKNPTTHVKPTRVETATADLNLQEIYC